MSKDDIEQIYKETISGFYIYTCVKNGTMDRGFYKNQLETFTEGFELGMKYKDK